MGDHTGGAGRGARQQTNYQRFTSHQEAIAFMDNAYAAGIAALPAAEQNALDVWTREGSNVHNSINLYLRHGIEPMSSYYMDRLAELDRAFKRRTAVLQHDLTVYRSFSTHYAAIKDLPVGATFTDYGFTSTTVSPRGLGWDTPNVEVRLPRGTRALWAAPLAVVKDEGEVLVKRGTTFRVIARDHDQPILEAIGQAR